MKKLNLTLAVLLALGLTACGSSSSDGGKSNDVVDNNKHQNDKDKKDKLPVVPSKEIIDPTNEDIVAQFDLEKQSSTGSNLYIRGKDSSFQKKSNPDYNSQSSVTYHNTLEGHLRNIFIVGSKSKDKDGKRVVYYAGQVDSTGTPLQNQNVDEIKPVLDGYYYSSAQGYNRGTKSVLKEIKAVVGPTSISGAKGIFGSYLELHNVLIAAKDTLRKAKAGTISTSVEDAAKAYNKALSDIVDKDMGTNLKAVKEVADDKNVNISYSETDFPKYLDKNGEEMDFSTAVPMPAGSSPATSPSGRKQVVVSPESYRKFAFKHRIRFNSFKGLTGDLYSKATGDVGLVVIKTEDGTDTVVKGHEEDEKRVQKTRIFGHKYLDTSGMSDANSYSGAVLNEEKTDIIAISQKLEHVQYGRVTADTEGKGQLAKTKDRYIYKVLDYANKDAKKESDAVDFYFARGEGATKVENMPKEGKLNYLGHAVTWGFAHVPAGEDHGAPNSVGNSAVVDGLGSFVKATLDASTKTFSGSVYDAYAFRKEGKYGDLQQHELINFKDAKVKGNTAFGEATAKGYDNKGELRASFFGPSAQEVAGVVNSVTAKDKRADAKWGAVFGAKQPNAAPDSDVIWNSDRD